MITFHKITYKNFLSTGNVPIEIPLSSSSNTLFVGTNGSGKSTYMDAICFALFGKPFRKVKKGILVNSTNNKDCVTEIEFETNGKEYKVIRGIKPNIFQIYCDGILLNQNASGRDYQAHLEKNILKMSYKAFTQIVILGSAKFIPFMSLPSADRRAVIEDLLDLQIFSVMSVIMKQKLATNKNDLTSTTVLLSSKEDTKRHLERTLVSLKEDTTKKIVDLSAQKNELTDEFYAYNQELEAKEFELDKLLKKGFDPSSIRAKHSKLIAMKSKIENNKDRVVKENIFYQENDTCPTCKQEIDAEHKYQYIQENDKKIKEFNDGLLKISDVIDGCVSEINNIEGIVNDINNIRIDVSSRKTNLKNLKSRIEDTENAIQALKTADKTTQESERQLKEIIQEIQELQSKKETLLEDRKYIDASILLLKDGGIKSQIIKQYVPIMNQHINKYLTKMGFGISFELNENFEETIKSRYRDEFEYNSFSEGEKLRIDLSILLTWRDIARIKNSINTNLIIFDEILDSSLDDDGVDEFLKIIWSLTEGTNTFIISHKDGMNEKFKETYRFRKQRNFTVLQKEN